MILKLILIFVIGTTYIFLMTYLQNSQIITAPSLFSAIGVLFGILLTKIWSL